MPSYLRRGTAFNNFEVRLTKPEALVNFSLRRFETWQIQPNLLSRSWKGAFRGPYALSFKRSFAG
jgi:hypothetical protein